MKQRARWAALSRFSPSLREGKASAPPSEGRVLLATDVAARGLDFPEVEHIVQLDPPQVNRVHPEKPKSLSWPQAASAETAFAEPRSVCASRGAHGSSGARRKRLVDSAASRRCVRGLSEQPRSPSCAFQRNARGRPRRFAAGGEDLLVGRGFAGGAAAVSLQKRRSQRLSDESGGTGKQCGRAARSAEFSSLLLNSVRLGVSMRRTKPSSSRALAPSSRTYAPTRNTNSPFCFPFR